MITKVVKRTGEKRFYQKLLKSRVDLENLDVYIVDEKSHRLDSFLLAAREDRRWTGLTNTVLAERVEVRERMHRFIAATQPSDREDSDILDALRMLTSTGFPTDAAVVAHSLIAMIVLNLESIATLGDGLTFPDLSVKDVQVYPNSDDPTSVSANQFPSFLCDFDFELKGLYGAKFESPDGLRKSIRRLALGVLFGVGGSQERSRVAFQATLLDLDDPSDATKPLEIHSVSESLTMAELELRDLLAQMLNIISVPVEEDERRSIVNSYIANHCVPLVAQCQAVTGESHVVNHALDYAFFPEKEDKKLASLMKYHSFRMLINVIQLSNFAIATLSRNPIEFLLAIRAYDNSKLLVDQGFSFTEFVDHYLFGVEDRYSHENDSSMLMDSLKALLSTRFQASVSNPYAKKRLVY